MDHNKKSLPIQIPTHNRVHSPRLFSFSFLDELEDDKQEVCDNEHFKSEHKVEVQYFKSEHKVEEQVQYSKSEPIANILFYSYIHPPIMTPPDISRVTSFKRLWEEQARK
jgi:hypothetical protein